MRETKTRPSDGAMQISQPVIEQKKSYAIWLTEQLTLLAEAFGESVTPERLAVNASDLTDIPQETMAEVFRRARQELKWYPKTAELREMAGVLSPQQKLDAGAMDAWLNVLKHVIKNGVDGTGAKPCFDDRTWHAVRAVGGLPRIHSVPDDELGFVKKEFLEAWKGAQHVQTYRQLSGRSDKEIMGQLGGAINSLSDGKRMS